MEGCYSWASTHYSLESMQIIRLLHQCRRDSGIDLRGGEPLVPHLLLDHGHRNAGHMCIDHMTVPEDMGGDFFLESFCLGETSWIPASRKPSMVRSTVFVLRCPELRPGKSHSWPGCRLFRMACRVPGSPGRPGNGGS